MNKNTKHKPGIVILSWNYSPKTYFEGTFRLDESSSNWEFNEGLARVSMNAKYPINKSTIKMALNKKIEAIFNGHQISNHKQYKIGEPCMEGYDSEGKFWLTPAPANLNLYVSGPDIIIKDSKGRIIVDTKAERLQEQKNLAELSLKYFEDPTVQAILRNYKSAVSEPNSEFCHLYAIREVLTVRFGAAKNVCSLLNIKKDEWKRLGKLCNDLPGQQGRHQGKKYEQPSKITEAELEDARKIIKTMTKQFFSYLEKSE
jgi:hypothetical protein